jgi:antitoxin MazE
VVPQKKKPTLEELLAQCKPENRHDEIDFGREGKELI